MDYVDISILLLECGADGSIPDNFGVTPVQCAFINNHIKMVEILSEWGYAYSYPHCMRRVMDVKASYAGDVKMKCLISRYESIFYDI